MKSLIQQAKKRVKDFKKREQELKKCMGTCQSFKELDEILFAKDLADKDSVCSLLKDLALSEEEFNQEGTGILPGECFRKTVYNDTGVKYWRLHDEVFNRLHQSAAEVAVRLYQVLANTFLSCFNLPVADENIQSFHHQLETFRVGQESGPYAEKKRQLFSSALREPSGWFSEKKLYPITELKNLLETWLALTQPDRLKNASVYQQLFDIYQACPYELFSASSQTYVKLQPQLLDCLLKHYLIQEIGFGNPDDPIAEVYQRIYQHPDNSIWKRRGFVKWLNQQFPSEADLRLWWENPALACSPGSEFFREPDRLAEPVEALPPDEPEDLPSPLAEPSPVQEEAQAKDRIETMTDKARDSYNALREREQGLIKRIEDCQSFIELNELMFAEKRKDAVQADNVKSLLSAVVREEAFYNKPGMGITPGEYFKKRCYETGGVKDWRLYHDICSNLQLRATQVSATLYRLLCDEFFTCFVIPVKSEKIEIFCQKIEMIYQALQKNQQDKGLYIERLSQRFLNALRDESVLVDNSTASWRQILKAWEFNIRQFLQQPQEEASYNELFNACQSCSWELFYDDDKGYKPIKGVLLNGLKQHYLTKLITEQQASLPVAYYKIYHHPDNSFLRRSSFGRWLNGQIPTIEALEKWYAENPCLKQNLQTPGQQPVVQPVKPSVSLQSVGCAPGPTIKAHSSSQLGQGPNLPPQSAIPSQSVNLQSNEQQTKSVSCAPGPIEANSFSQLDHKANLPKSSVPGQSVTRPTKQQTQDVGGVPGPTMEANNSSQLGQRPHPPKSSVPSQPVNLQPNEQQTQNVSCVPGSTIEANNSSQFGQRPQPPKSSVPSQPVNLQPNEQQTQNLSRAPGSIQGANSSSQLDPGPTLAPKSAVPSQSLSLQPNEPQTQNVAGAQGSTMEANSSSQLNQGPNPSQQIDLPEELKQLNQDLLNYIEERKKSYYFSDRFFKKKMSKERKIFAAGSLFVAVNAYLQKQNNVLRTPSPPEFDLPALSEGKLGKLVGKYLDHKVFQELKEALVSYKSKKPESNLKPF